jgi:hypothetical protein
MGINTFEILAKYGEFGRMELVQTRCFCSWIRTNSNRASWEGVETILRSVCANLFTPLSCGMPILQQLVPSGLCVIVWGLGLAFAGVEAVWPVRWNICLFVI